MSSILIAVLVALASCIASPNPRPPAPVFDGVTLCAPAVRPTTSDACQSTITKRESRPCFRCSQQGCWDKEDAIYCVIDDCLDPYCKISAGKK